LSGGSQKAVIDLNDATEAAGAVWWHVYPLGFVGAETDAAACSGVTHRLSRLTAWLEYAADLGVSGIMLGPVFASSTHGYDTIDHFHLDGRLGDDADFDGFVEAAHRRGLRVMLDGVFNHVGRDFPAFQRAIAGGPQATEASWFHLTWLEGAPPGVGPDYAMFEGHRQLVVLNHDEPAVVDYVTRVMTHWLDRGAHGWRLDAAYAVPRPFWRNVLPAVRARHPDAYIFGEVIHGDYAGFVRDTGVDAVTQYELWKAIWSALNDRNLFELAWALGRHNVMLDSFVPQTFVGNHDVTRLASQLRDERHLAHALVVLMTIGGTPSIYAGDEQAFRGIKEHRAGGDDAIRPAFPATPLELAPFGWPIHRLHQELIGLRQRHPWLHRARSRVVELSNTALTFESFHGDNRVWVALNLAGASVLRAIDGPADILGGVAACRKGQATEITLPP
jgi:glycosidase